MNATDPATKPAPVRSMHVAEMGKHTKSYATPENLAKATAKVDEILTGPGAPTGAISKINVIHPETGKHTAIYFLRGEAVTFARMIADHGFMVFG